MSQSGADLILDGVFMTINWKWMLIGLAVGIALAAVIVQKGSAELATALKLSK